MVIFGIVYHAIGGFAAGSFYLARPGKMRIEYDPPVPYLYVANGSWLTFWDEELGQRTDVPIGSTLADFITREDVSLDGEGTVTDVRRVPGLGEIEIDPAYGVTLQDELFRAPRPRRPERDD